MPVGHQGGRGINIIIPIAQFVRTFIRLSGIALTAAFVWLQLKGVPFRQYLGTVEPDSLRRVTLAIYYACWYFGSQFDVNIQERVLFSGEGQIKLDWRGIGLLILCVGLAAVLFWCADNDILLAVVLGVFLILNMIGFRFILNFLKSPFEISRAKYRLENHHQSVLQLEIVASYMYGRWQWFRFATGTVIIVILNLICFNTTARDALAYFLQPLLPNSNRAHLLPSLVLFIFVFVMEIWIWIMRAGTRLLLNLVQQIQVRYGLTLGPTDPPRVAS